jgi:hypothetical protein
MENLENEFRMFDIGPVASGAVEYESNLRYIMKYIHSQLVFKGVGDIVTTLENNEHIDFDAEGPETKVSVKTDPDGKKALNKRVLTRKTERMQKIMLTVSNCIRRTSRRSSRSFGSGYSDRFKNDHVEL